MQLTFIGTGHSDRQDFIYKKTDPEVLTEIFNKIIEIKRSWDVAVFEEIQEDSYTVSKLSNYNYKISIENSSTCPFINIEGKLENFLNGYSKKFKRDLKHKVNKLKRHGKWDFHVSNDNNYIAGHLEEMSNIEKRSRKKETEKMFLTYENNMKFLTKICQAFNHNINMDYSTLTLESKTIGYLLGFIYCNKYYAYNMAFDENFHDVSPGKLLMNEKIKWCFCNDRQISEFDFLRGATHMKYLWAADDRKHVRMVLFNGSLTGELMRMAVFKIRPLLNKLRKND